MRRYRVEHYKGIDARSTAELAEKLNEFIREHIGDEVRVEKTPDLRSALLVWQEHVEEPETLVEHYEAEGRGMTCGDCPFKKPETDGRHKYMYTCMHKKPGTNAEDRACNWFYMQMEEGKV